MMHFIVVINGLLSAIHYQIDASQLVDDFKIHHRAAADAFWAPLGVRCLGRLGKKDVHLSPVVPLLECSKSLDCEDQA